MAVPLEKIFPSIIEKLKFLGYILLFNCWMKLYLEEGLILIGSYVLYFIIYFQGFAEARWPIPLLHPCREVWETTEEERLQWGPVADNK